MGNDRPKTPLFARVEWPAIAHKELIASARVVAFDVAERDFPRNRSPPRWKFMYPLQRKVSAPADVAYFHQRPRCSPRLSKALVRV
jgi:hypothetical protein